MSATSGVTAYADGDAPSAAPRTPSPTSPGAPSRGSTDRVAARFLLLLPAALALLAGLDAAMLLLGLPAPVTTQRLPDMHGMLLVFGVVGTR